MFAHVRQSGGASRRSRWQADRESLLRDVPATTLTTAFCACQLRDRPHTRYFTEPAFFYGTMAVDPGEVHDFLESVNEVSRLIDGLAAGTLPPEYVDGKIAARAQAAGSQRGPAPCAAARPGPTKRTAGSTQAFHATGSDAEACRDAGGPGGGEEADAARKAELMRKVGLERSTRRCASDKRIWHCLPPDTPP